LLIIFDTYGPSTYVFQELGAIVLGDALQQDFRIGALAHESIVDQDIISRSPDEAFVFYLVMKACTIKEILDERHAPIIAVGCQSGVLDEQCLAIWLIDQVAPMLGLSMS